MSTTRKTWSRTPTHTPSSTPTSFEVLPRPRPGSYESFTTGSSRSAGPLARPELKVLEGGLEESSAAIEVALRLERATIARLSRATITKAIERLPEELRTAVVMCDIEGFSYQEIAEIMDCPVGTVRSRIARAREHLMRALAAEATTLGIGRVRKQ